MPRKTVLIEVCIEHSDDANPCVEAGADRIELNSDLEQDGLTPSLESVRQVASLPVPVIAMLRPHAHSFHYDAADRRKILHDAERLLACGASGLAFGALTPEGNLDFALIEQVRRLSTGRALVIHRVFDFALDADSWLERLVEIGVDRIVTCGGREFYRLHQPVDVNLNSMPSASENLIRLKHLRQLAGDRIEILPASGIRSDNAARIIRETGCDQLHGTFRQLGLPTIRPDIQAIRHTRRILDELVDP